MRLPALVLLLVSLASGSFAQTLLTENFQSYQGFGDTPTGGWTTSGFTGYKVYLRKVSADSTGKVCEISLNPNKTGDSLTTPSFGPLAENAVLEFQSRLVETYSSITPTFNHIPAAGDVVAAFLSTDGGNTFAPLQNLLPSYPSSGLGFTSFSLPINGNAGNNARVKIVTKRTAGSWFPSFDNFVAYNLTPAGKKIIGTPGLQILPNPATGTRNITIQAQGFENQARLEVFNILGTRVRLQPFGNGRAVLDLQDLDPGLYIVKVSEGRNSVLSRLILR